MIPSFLALLSPALSSLLSLFCALTYFYITFALFVSVIAIYIEDSDPLEFYSMRYLPSQQAFLMYDSKLGYYQYSVANNLVSLLFGYVGDCVTMAGVLVSVFTIVVVAVVVIVIVIDWCSICTLDVCSPTEKIMIFFVLPTDKSSPKPRILVRFWLGACIFVSSRRQLSNGGWHHEQRTINVRWTSFCTDILFSRACSSFHRNTAEFGHVTWTGETQWMTPIAANDPSVFFVEAEISEYANVNRLEKQTVGVTCM